METAEYRAMKRADLCHNLISYIVSEGGFVLQPIVLELHYLMEQLDDTGCEAVLYDMYLALKLGDTEEGRSQQRDALTSAAALLEERTRQLP